MAARRENSGVLLAWSKMVPVSKVDDPLGLSGRVSARLASQLLHCITSITPRARYFSFLPWCVSDFWRREKSSRADARLADAVRLREKALTLGCVLHHGGETCKDGRLVGSKEAIEWVGANPGRSPALSQLTLVQNPAFDDYYNSLVQLGFFKETLEENGNGGADVEERNAQAGTGDVELSDLGRRMASAYEKAVGNLPVVAKVVREPDGCKPSELKKWGEFGGICEIAVDGAPDRALLREVFFDRVGSPGLSHRFRHDSLVLLLELTDRIAAHGIAVDHRILGDVVYYGATAAGDDGEEELRFEVPPQLADIANRWRMFYFHHYLSVALEGLLVGLVGYVLRAGMVGTRLEKVLASLKSKPVAKFLKGVVGRDVGGDFLDMTPRGMLEAAGFRGGGTTLESGRDFGRHFGRLHPMSERRLADELRYGDIAYASPEGIACALVLLAMTVFRYTAWENGPYGNWLARAARDPYRDVTVPVVLQALRESLGDFMGATWREVANLVLGRFVISQHEVLSYEKVWDGSRALFHSEQGLIRWRGLGYDDVAAENSRFYSAIQILEDLGLAEHEDGERWQVELTTEGRRFLRAELERMVGP